MRFRYKNLGFNLKKERENQLNNKKTKTCDLDAKDLHEIWSDCFKAWPWQFEHKHRVYLLNINYYLQCFLEEIIEVSFKI